MTSYCSIWSPTRTHGCRFDPQEPFGIQVADPCALLVCDRGGLEKPLGFAHRLEGIVDGEQDPVCPDLGDRALERSRRADAARGDEDVVPQVLGWPAARELDATMVLELPPGIE